jgi:hypothetical protein
MKKHKLNVKAKVFQYTVHLCWLKQRQVKARGKLLKAVQECTDKKELNTLLLFGQFLLDEPAVQEAYRKRLTELEQRAVA